MKKKLLSLLLVSTMVLSVTACSNKNSASEDTTASSGVTAEDYNAQISVDATTYAQYVTLGEYKGVEVEVDRSTLEISDSDVTEYIDSVRKQYAETTQVTTGTTKGGDTITLDYSGLLDGVAFSGGTATDTTYTVGSGQFIDDLDKGLAGLEVGQEYDLPCKFPDNYSGADLAGKDVIFRVKVTAITQSTLPDYNDEFVVKAAADNSIEVSTTAEFTEYVTNYLKDQAQSTFDNAKYQLVLQSIMDKTTISGYPDAEVNSLVETIVGKVQSEYAAYGSYYGISDYATYLSSVYGFESEDALNEYAVEYAKSYLEEKMIITLIGSKENASVSADEITDMGNQIADYYGYDSYQEILDTYGNTMNAEVGYSVLSDKVIKILIDSAVEK